MNKMIKRIGVLALIALVVYESIRLISSKTHIYSIVPGDWEILMVFTAAMIAVLSCVVILKIKPDSVEDEQ